MIYETTISYISIDKNGNDKVVKERFIIDNAETFSDCENAMYEIYKEYSDIDVIAIKRSRLQEFVNKRTNPREKIFISDLEDTFIDDDGNEKEMRYSIAFYALDIESAYAFITEYIKQGYDLKIVALKKTKFIDWISINDIK